MSQMRKFYLLALTSLAFASAHCAGGKKLIAKPQLSVESLRVVGLSPTTADLEVTLAVDNPNPLGLNLSRVQYDFSLEGQRLVGGQTDRASSIPAAGVGRVVFPLSVSYQDLVAVYDRVKGQDEVNYTIQGELGLATPLGTLPLPFQSSGRMPVVRLPRLAEVSLKVDSLGLRETRLRLILELENPNAFPLELARLRYRLALAGSDLAAGETSASQTLPSKAAGRIEIPLAVSPFDLGGSVYNLLRGSSADYRMEYSAEAVGPAGRFRQEASKAGTLQIRR